MATAEALEGNPAPAALYPILRVGNYTLYATTYNQSSSYNNWKCSYTAACVFGWTEAMCDATNYFVCKIPAQNFPCYVSSSARLP